MTRASVIDANKLMQLSKHHELIKGENMYNYMCIFKIKYICVLIEVNHYRENDVMMEERKQAIAKAVTLIMLKWMGSSTKMNRLTLYRNKG